LENQLKQRKEELTRRTAKRELDGRVKQQQNEKLLAAIRSRSINIAGGVDKAKFIVDPNAAESPPVIAVSPAMLFPLPDEVVYNMRPALCQDMNGVEEGGLQWPVCFIYPQMETYDLVSDWHESTSVRDQLDQVLHGRDDFPAELRVQYSASSELAVYYPNLLQSRGWKRVPPLASLEAILAGGCPIAEDGIVRLWVMPKPIRNGWTTQWIAKHSIA
jgi:hypothetical protein